VKCQTNTKSKYDTRHCAMQAALCTPALPEQGKIEVIIRKNYLLENVLNDNLETQHSEKVLHNAPSK